MVPEDGTRKASLADAIIKAPPSGRRSDGGLPWSSTQNADEKKTEERSISEAVLNPDAAWTLKDTQMIQAGSDKWLSPSCRSKEIPSPQEHLEGMEKWLKPLSNPVRLRLLIFLRRPHYLEEIASHLGMSHQAARKHVNQLVEAGWVERAIRKGTSIVDYTLNMSALIRATEEIAVLCSLLDAGGTGARHPLGIGHPSHSSIHALFE